MEEGGWFTLIIFRSCELLKRNPIPTSQSIGRPLSRPILVAFLLVQDLLQETALLQCFFGLCFVIFRAQAIKPGNELGPGLLVQRLLAQHEVH